MLEKFLSEKFECGYIYGSFYYCLIGPGDIHLFPTLYLQIESEWHVIYPSDYIKLVFT